MSMNMNSNTSCIADIEDGDARTEASTNMARTTSTNRYSYVATGIVANARLSPLLPTDWVDITGTRGHSTSAENETAPIIGNNDSESTEARRKTIPDFLWENAPRHKTKGIRDDVKVYSHLPNGINILDSKWVLGRIFANAIDEKNPLLTTCVTHCFAGLDGFNDFARSVELLSDDDDNNINTHNDLEEASVSTKIQQHQLQQQQSHKMQGLEKIIQNLPDIAKGSNSPPPTSASIERPPTDVLNWWVVKDAGANGAGGVWVVGRDNAEAFGNSGASPIIPSHKYVAQQYVWPPVLYDGKKCHVRVYVTITYDGRAFIHRRAFLHVANDKFTVLNDGKPSSSGGVGAFDDCIHITNCCANSHDDTKFAGEILADFGESEYTTWRGDDDSKNNSNYSDQQPVVPLAEFFPSVQATVSAVVENTFRLGLLNGGEKNHGFEYCGMDFMLSYKEKEADENINDNNDALSDGSPLQPVAYLLEINSPPSQDTASSLPHAEHLHNEVLKDWMTGWVIPNIDCNYPIRPGGWQKCEVKQHGHNSVATCSINNTSRIGNSEQSDTAQESGDMLLPSKAAILNKIRWALFERKVQKSESLALSERQIGTAVEKPIDNIVNDDNDFNDNDHEKEKDFL